MYVCVLLFVFLPVPILFCGLSRLQRHEVTNWIIFFILFKQRLFMHFPETLFFFFWLNFDGIFHIYNYGSDFFSIFNPKLGVELQMQVLGWVWSCDCQGNQPVIIFFILFEKRKHIFKIGLIILVWLTVKYVKFIFNPICYTILTRSPSNIYYKVFYPSRFIVLLILSRPQPPENNFELCLLCLSQKVAVFPPRNPRRGGDRAFNIPTV